MGAATHRVARMLVTGAAAAGLFVPCFAQSPSHFDSARVASMINDIASGPTMAARARRAILVTLETRQLEHATEVLAYVDEYAPRDLNRFWMTPAERLVAEVVLANPQRIISPQRLHDFLVGWRSERRQHADFHDGLYDKLRDLLRRSSGPIGDELARWNIDDEGRLFFTILMNHLLVSGIRGREKLNQLIDQFAADYPESALVDIARDHIAFVYQERPLGAALHVGYASGRFDGSLADAFRSFYGPVLGAECYFWDLTVAVEASIGLAEGRRALALRSGTWPMGESSLINCTIDAGYEVRFGRAAVTPMVGAAFQDLRAMEAAGVKPEDRPMSGVRVGFDAAVQGSYRIAFDRGPHVDFRLRVGRTQTSLDSFEETFGGGLWQVGLGVAIVYRPYVE